LETVFLQLLGYEKLSIFQANAEPTEQLNQSFLALKLSVTASGLLAKHPINAVFNID